MPQSPLNAFPGTVTQVTTLRIVAEGAATDMPAKKLLPSAWTATVGMRVAYVQLGPLVLVLGPYS